MWLDIAVWSIGCGLPVLVVGLLSIACYLDWRDNKRNEAEAHRQQVEAQQEKIRVEQLLVETLEQIFSTGVAGSEELRLFADYYLYPSTFVDVVWHCHFQVTLDELLAAATKIFYRAQPAVRSASSYQQQTERCQRYLRRITIAFEKAELDGWNKILQSFQDCTDSFADMSDSYSGLVDTYGESVDVVKGLVRHVYKRKPFIFF